VHLLDAIFSKPIFRSPDLTAQLFQNFGVHEKTTPGLLQQMKNLQKTHEAEIQKQAHQINALAKR
jgi:hypothetical protein